MPYLKRILVTLIAFILLSYLISHFIFKGLYYHSSSSYQKFDEMFNQTDDYDVVLIGNSRTHRNIDVRVLDSITGKRFYNAGISGAGGFEMFVALKGFISKHHSAKTVVLNVDNGILNTERGFFNSSFYINSFNNEEIYKAFNEKKYPVVLYKYVPFFKMIEFNDDMRKNSVDGLSNRISPILGLYKGYLPMPEGMENLDTSYNKKETLDLSEKKIKYMDSIVLFCKSRNLNLSLIVSPIYKNYIQKKHPSYSEILNHVTNAYSGEFYIPCRNFDTLNMCIDKKNFWDNIHLNSTGTKLFSTYLAKFLSDEMVLSNNYR